ncbi:MAG: response regulator [Chlamydiota bacterium]
MSDGGDSYKELMEDLAKNYRASLPDKIQNLSDLVLLIKEDPSVDNISKLREEAHKISGSAGMYGFMELGDICKKEVLVLDEWKERAKKKKLKAKDIKELQAFIKKLEGAITKQETRFFEEEFKTKPLSKGEAFSCDLFLAYFDEDLLRLVEKEAKRRNLRVLIQNEPDTIVKTIQDKDFRPRVMIMGKCFSKKPMVQQKLKEGFEPIRWLKEFKKKEKQTLLGIILPEIETDLRFLVMKEGIDYIVDEPVIVNSIFEVVESSIPAYFEKAFKVLVVEEDPDVCSFISSVLGGINVEVKTMTSPEKFFDALASFRPHLILLDVKLDGQSGLEVLQAIRKDPTFSNIPVIMITPLREEEMEITAYKGRVDDFLIKPIVRSVLQSKVLRFAYSQSYQELEQVRDLVTGFYTKRAFVYSLSRQIEQIPSEDITAGVGLLTILQYAEIKKEDAVEADRLVVEISNYLKRTFPGRDLMVRYEENTFGIYFENVSSSEVKKNLEACIADCPVAFKLKGKREKRVSFCAGVAIFPPDGKTAEELLKSAKKYLLKAEASGSGFVECTDIIPTKKKTQEIFLLDDDTDICSILSFAFTKEGFSVTVKNTIQEAEDDMRKRHLSDLPSLFILDRVLPDGDGLEFYREMKREYEKFPSVLFLSRLSAEKDVMDGLKEGAVDYIAKPFSMAILMEKALKLIKK